MIAGMRIGERVSPQRGGKNDRRKQKQDAGDFEPENSSHAAKGAQESADAAGHGLPGVGGSVGGRLGGRLYLDSGSGKRRGLRGLQNPRLLRVGRNPQADNSSGHADSDAESPANGARSHTVYDGSSGPWRFAPRQRSLGCYEAGLAVR